MSIFAGTSEVKSIKAGTADVKAVYAGTKKVWPSDEAVVPEAPMHNFAGRVMYKYSGAEDCNFEESTQTVVDSNNSVVINNGELYFMGVGYVDGMPEAPRYLSVGGPAIRTDLQSYVSHEADLKLGMGFQIGGPGNPMVGGPPRYHEVTNRCTDAGGMLYGVDYLGYAYKMNKSEIPWDADKIEIISDIGYVGTSRDSNEIGANDAMPMTGALLIIWAINPGTTLPDIKNMIHSHGGISPSKTRYSGSLAYTWMPVHADGTFSFDLIGRVGHLHDAAFGALVVYEKAK